MANCPDRAAGVPCTHRLGEYARKKIDLAYVAAGGPTECGCEAWVSAIQRYHTRGAKLEKGKQCLTLTNCDPTKWATSPWEVAKAYVSPLGKFNAVSNQPEDSVLAKVSADDFDPGALFNLPQYCLAFQGATVTLPNGSPHTFPVSIDKARWVAATTARNHTLGHSVRMGLEEAPYNEAMTTLEALLEDPALHIRGQPYVENAKWALEQLKWIKEASAKEMEDRCVTQITEARDYASHRRRAVKFLTDEQADEFLDWRNRTLLKGVKPGEVVDPLRWLVQASSGTGKTLIAVKMAAAFIADGVPTHDRDFEKDGDSDDGDFEEGRDGDGSGGAAANHVAEEKPSFLLLGHSKTLVHGVLLPDLLATLENESEFLGPHAVERRTSRRRCGEIEVSEEYVAPYPFENSWL